MQAFKAFLKSTFLLALCGLIIPLGLFGIFIAKDMVVIKWDKYWLENNVKNKEYQALCLTHSYSISPDDKIINYNRYRATVSHYRLLMPDDGLWVIFAIKGKTTHTFNANRELVEKYFNNVDTETCVSNGLNK